MKNVAEWIYCLKDIKMDISKRKEKYVEVVILWKDKNKKCRKFVFKDKEDIYILECGKKIIISKKLYKALTKCKKITMYSINHQKI